MSVNAEVYPCSQIVYPFVTNTLGNCSSKCEVNKLQIPATLLWLSHCGHALHTVFATLPV